MGTILMSNPVPVRDPAQVDLKALRVSFYSDNGLAAPRADIGDLIRGVATEISPYVASVSEAVPKIGADTYTAFEELFFYGGIAASGCMTECTLCK